MVYFYIAEVVIKRALMGAVCWDMARAIRDHIMVSTLFPSCTHT